MNLSSFDTDSQTVDERENGPLQEWYAGIAGTGFDNEFFVLYVHKSSFLTVIVRGKTIQGTYDMFLARLEKLLARFSFPQGFIASAIKNVEDYIASEPGDSRIVSQVNQFAKLIAYLCSKSNTYESVDVNAMEDKLMRHIYQYNSSKIYPPPLTYWEQMLGFTAETMGTI